MAASFIEAAARGDIQAIDSPNDLYCFCNLFSVKKRAIYCSLHLDFIYIQTYKQRVRAYLGNGATPDSEQNEVSFIQHLQ